MATPETARRPDVIRLPDADDEPRHRGWRIAVGVIVGLVIFVPLLLFLSLAWLRMLPWSGPLVLETSTPDTYGKAANVGYTDLQLTNPSRVDVTLDSVVAHAEPAVDVGDAWLISDDPACERFLSATHYREVPERCRVPMEGSVVPAGTQVMDHFVVVVEVETPKEQDWNAAAFDLHFHAGPIAYSKPFGDPFTMRAEE